MKTANTVFVISRCSPAYETQVVAVRPTREKALAFLKESISKETSTEYYMAEGPLELDGPETLEPEFFFSDGAVHSAKEFRAEEERSRHV